MKFGALPSRTRRRLALIPFALSASVLAYAADNSAPFLIADRAVSANPSAWSLTIDGQWPTQCTPSLKSVSLDGTELRLDARSDLTLCERTAAPFSIELNPALALDKTSLDPGIYHVSFYAEDGTNATPKLRAFSLVDRSAPDAEAIVPESGFWFTSNGADSTTDRTVVSVEMQNGQLTVSLMGYDGIGQPVWYFGAAPFNGHIAHVPLVHIVGGSDLFNPSASSAHGDATLTLDMQFESGAHALSWLSRQRGSADDPTLQVQPLDLVRLPLSESRDGQAWQGDWVLVADADDTAPSKLHLTQYRAVDAQHFALSDATGESVLTCTREPSQPEWPPSSCSLTQKSGALAGAFDSVALSRMDGQTSAGGAIHLLRLSR